MKSYRITGVGEPFDGLVALVRDEDDVDDAGILPVTRLWHPSFLFGSYSVPLTSESFWISRDFLEPYDEPKLSEFQGDNPLGAFQSAAAFRLPADWDVEVLLTTFTNGARVKAKRGNSILFDKYFKGAYSSHELRELRDFIEMLRTDLEYDSDDIEADFREIYGS